MGEERHLTPAHHVDALLTRAQNPFDVSDRVLERLCGAVMFRVELHGWRHRNVPPPMLRCSSFRHVFLLADGSSLVLWELCYDSGGAEGTELYEVYDSAEALRRSEHRVHSWMGGGPEAPGAPAPHENPADGDDGHDAPGGPGGLEGVDPDGFEAEDGLKGHGFEGHTLGEYGLEEHDGFGALDGCFDSADPLGERGHGPTRISFDFLAATGAAYGRREYTETDSPEHARRLLRRAENRDRPGEETLTLLATALGHHILHVPKPLVPATDGQVWCSVYEHAFLLADGSKVSLYELEHNLTGSGRLVCEVYLDETVADQAAQRLARDRGIDL
ncbi:DUF6227 family protein [Streptomyces sp. NBC_01795]|uniref:DUF6227 family protein n=1 Tax=unclassified Streptomyces TaxID=2593676 RepID=UPI002DDC635A|nr:MULTISPECIES: DUF6227 family protein [unclassified Streptomyces]WSA91048.1 DUF6227 family protein [Streptomyces sp. NBC_01795]WSB75373.1 DUF6227 family protein [Streptomyces sp. NBC_01775]WSS16345.1 DUF6227 family protein [Streptomyces sp. NBC_01186]